MKPLQQQLYYLKVAASVGKTKDTSLTTQHNHTLCSSYFKRRPRTTQSSLNNYHLCRNHIIFITILFMLFAKKVKTALIGKPKGNKLQLLLNFL